MKKRRFNWLFKNKLRIAIAVISLAVGFFFGIGFNYEKNFSIQFDDKINPTDLLSVFVGIILVWVITDTLDKEKEADRASKSVIQQRIHELYLFVDDFSRQNFTKDYLYTDATSSLSRIDSGIFAIEKLITATKLNIDTTVTTEVKNAAENLSKLLTNTEIRDESDKTEKDLKVENGICHFTADHLNKIKNRCNNLKDALLQLEIDINVS